jgi:integrating conjugative element protein (TIGR03749 family)
MSATRIFLSVIVLTMLSTLSQAMTADVAPHRVQWQQIPIPVVLSIGEERRVHFRAPVSVGVPASLQAMLRTQTVNGTVYLLAHAPFAETRVLVRELDGGQTYLLDLRAGVEAGSVGSIYVEYRSNANTSPAAGSTVSPGTHSYVSLTRFAAQQLFAPLRLLTPLPGVARIPVQQKSVFLVPGDAVEATPLMAWRAGNLYLTAVKLRNRSGKAQVLDPRLLRGQWLAATLQHARLLPAGDVADSTAVYLISAQPFAASF